MTLNDSCKDTAKLDSEKMLPSILKSLLASSCLAATAMAVTPVSDRDMNELLSAGGVSLAMKAQPMWFFGQAMNQKPCIPVSATQNGNQQTPSSKLCDWPNAGCDCVTPDKGIGNPSQSFPIYYSYQRCAENSVRVAYNLFFQKDGFTPQGVFGHPYDWERVIVVWKRMEDSQWRPYEIYLSEHSGYLRKTWDQIQNTFDDSTASQPRGGPEGVKYKDHAKVYVAWAKHAIYDTRNTASFSHLVL